MPTDVPIRCSCGALRGVAKGVSGSAGNRIVCYCDDCQSFAHFLKHPDTVLDANGGTDIFQMSPARLEFSEGADHLTCMRLTPRGMLRWFADCCNTPIGNTMAAPGMPFVGLIHSCSDTASAGDARDASFGPVRARVNARFAKGNRGRLDAHDRAPVSMVLRFARVLLGARMRGDHKRSPFFDPSGEPVAKPRVLDEDELRAVEAARDA